MRDWFSRTLTSSNPDQLLTSQRGQLNECTSDEVRRRRTPDLTSKKNRSTVTGVRHSQISPHPSRPSHRCTKSIVLERVRR